MTAPFPPLSFISLFSLSFFSLSFFSLCSEGWRKAGSGIRVGPWLFHACCWFVSLFFLRRGEARGGERGEGRREGGDEEREMRKGCTIVALRVVWYI